MPLNLSESDITAQVKGFLEARNWRAIRMQRAVVPGAFQSGEPGIPDFLFVRYLDNGVALALWLEFKSPRDRRKCRCLEIRGTRKRCTVCDQHNWQQREKARGARVWRVDDLDRFSAQYEQAYGWLHKGDSARGQMELATA